MEQLKEICVQQRLVIYFKAYMLVLQMRNKGKDGNSRSIEPRELLVSCVEVGSLNAD
jgi:hypothetical protein